MNLLATNPFVKELAKLVATTMITAGVTLLTNKAIENALKARVDSPTRSESKG